jgi:putative addiction module killer protein
VATATLRLEMGNSSNVKWIGTIGEYRIDWGPGYRLYLGRDGEALIILLVGGTKRRQKADIEKAKALFAEYKVRKAAAAKGRR